jgi:hypothetical protein
MMLTVCREGESRRKYVADDRFELPPLTEPVVGADGRRNGEVAPVVESEPVRQQPAATPLRHDGSASGGGRADRAPADRRG